MGKALDRLLSIASEPSRALAPVDWKHSGGPADELAAVLLQRNGFYAFGAIPPRPGLRPGRARGEPRNHHEAILSAMARPVSGAAPLLPDERSRYVRRAEGTTAGRRLCPDRSAPTSMVSSLLGRDVQAPRTKEGIGC